MQNNIKVFESNEFGTVRIVMIGEQPWWVLSDVCRVLGISNPSKVAQRLDNDEKLKVDPKSELGSRSNTPITVISESGLYAVILRSDKPNAKDFRKWITSEVIPSIRKHGAYMTDDVLDQLIENPETATKLFAKLKNERSKKEALKKYVEILTPKARYHDIVLQSPGNVLTTVIAKDYGMSAVKFNKLLHALEVQFRYKTNSTWFLYEKHENKGYTDTITYHLNGNSYIHMVWTQKGRFWLYEYLKAHGIYPKAEQPVQLELTEPFAL